MSTFANILKIKCKSHPDQNINEYMKTGNTLKPVCFDCKESLPKEGVVYYTAKNINNELNNILSEIQKTTEVKQKLMDNIRKFRDSINKKLDQLQTKLESDFEKILNNSNVRTMKEYYSKETPVHEPSDHIKYATQFLKFENNQIDKNDFTMQLFNSIDIVRKYSTKIQQLSEQINKFSFQENTQQSPQNQQNQQIQKNQQNQLPYQSQVQPPIQQRKPQSVQICQKVKTDVHSQISTSGKMFCLTIKPLKSFSLTTLWMSRLAFENQEPLLNIGIYQNTIDTPVQKFDYKIKTDSPIINEKYKIQLKQQCELQVGNKYAILIDHPKDFQLMSADFFKGIEIQKNGCFEIIDGFIPDQQQKKILNQIDEGLICDIDIII